MLKEISAKVRIKIDDFTGTISDMYGENHNCLLLFIPSLSLRYDMLRSSVFNKYT
jgi:hypothetical protein